MICLDGIWLQSWPALNMLLVGMADGSFWGGSKNAGLLNASSPHELELIFKLVFRLRTFMLL